ncbi:hypothetical protein KAR91_76445 [Candidatus Pacearchaeota archaeon]|nr:hypothetical protein [Candidatus Pacearchaeota archaeon]
MNILGTLLGGNTIASPVQAIGNVFDKLFTSDEERMKAQVVLDKLAQHPAELQVELNKLEAQHRSIFVAGWRPFIGWTCGLGLGYAWLLRPVIIDVALIYGITPQFSELPLEHMIDLVIALLGLSGLRTYEKLKGRAG